MPKVLRVLMVLMVLVVLGARAGTQTAPERDVVISGQVVDGANSRRVVGVRADRDGRHTIRNLPPGDYRILATADLEQAEWFDPSVLERLLPTAQPLTITGPDKLALNLTVR